MTYILLPLYTLRSYTSIDTGRDDTSSNIGSVKEQHDKSNKEERKSNDIHPSSRIELQLRRGNRRGS